jgi:hypothetical protein
MAGLLIGAEQNLRFRDELQGAEDRIRELVRVCFYELIIQMCLPVIVARVYRY